MQACLLEQGVCRYVQDATPPIPQPHEVLVRVQLAGICETDLQLLRGYMNFSGIPGHEFVGVAMSGRYAGQRVVGEINCCACPACRAQPEHRQHCPSRSVIGILNHSGAFAALVPVPEANLHPLPDRLDNDRAVFVEPLAAAFQIRKQIAITPEDRIIVLGDGRLGYLIAQVLAETGAHLLVIGKHAEKLNRFTARGLRTRYLSELEHDLVERNATVVVDCTGSPSGFEWACRLVQPGGTIVLKTTIAGEQNLSLAPLVIDEIRLLGSRCGPFDVALQALQEDRIDVRSLITARYSLSEIEQAFVTATQPGQHKVLIEIDA